MDEAARWLTVLGIIVYVVVVSELAVFVARDMDRRGHKGWMYGAVTFMAPPFGLLAWLFDRNSDRMRVLNAELLLVAIVTFPWSVIAWLLITQPWHRDHGAGA